MSSERPDPPRDIDPQSGTDMVIGGVLELVNAALGVGATLAKTVAQETAAGKPVPTPTNHDSALNDMVHYGVTAVSNVIGLVVSGAGIVTDPIRTATGQPPNSTQTASSEHAPASPSTLTPPSSPASSIHSATLPTVHPGSNLRMPLSIQNPTDGPMTEMTFTCLSLESMLTGEGEPLTASHLRFLPAVLEIAPRDFEKLTVFVETETTTAPGRYQAVIGIGPENFETVLQFQVVTE